MAVGLPIPKSITERLKNNETALKVLVAIYKQYLKLYLKIWTFWKINRKEKASIDPYRLIYVEPIHIEYFLTKDGENYNKDFFRPRIKDGNWDKKIRKIENKDQYQALKTHIINGKELKKTKYFKKISNNLNKPDKYSYRAKDTSELNKSIENLKKIIENIKQHGYKKQSDLDKEINTRKYNKTINPYLGSLNEIIVSIGRNGEILLEDGNHRTITAKILYLEKIPVRVLVRHSEWQEKRNMAVKNPHLLPEELRNHPDIEYLLNH